MKSNEARARRQLDERLLALKRQVSLPPPPKGWVRAIRDALGMTGAQLGQRLGVSAQTVDALEKSETAGTLQLKNLSRLAEAMNCTLVYALVPNTSLTRIVDERARQIAVHDLARVAHTMRLEAQETTLKLLSLMGSESQWDKDMGTISVRPRITKPPHSPR